MIIMLNTEIVYMKIIVEIENDEERLHNSYKFEKK